MDVQQQRAGRRPRLPRRTNLALAVLLPAAVLTGLSSNTIGVDWPVDLAAAHAAVALAILLLAPWKSAIVRRGLRRGLGPGGRRRYWSLTLLALVAIALASGLAHATGRVEEVGPLTIMQVHVGAAVLALPVLFVHWRLHPVRPRSTDLDRRALLGAATLTAGATAAYLAWEGGLALGRLPGADRRFTGSVERGTGDPAAMPVVAWLDDRVQRLDPANWRLRVGTAALDLAAIQALPQERIRAVLDCTSAWYAEQDWTGVRLDRLIDAARATRPDGAGFGPAGWRSVRVRSATGYDRLFPTSDLGRLWLATGVGGAPLSYGHGYPARIVAPGRRGFWWVKWVVEISPSDTPWWLQPPFPLT
ncbi:MAG TPA: molybdopterin-dependent oxidoreductase [Mycobacteriales bacterium]|nr:molybdopterin-dependent oxidoreductase [Mycobacteriales bacterium]